MTGAEAGDGTESIRIVRGAPTEEELAALVAVLAAAAAGREAAPAPSTAASGWADHSRYVRAAVAPSPNGWRAAGFPR